MPRESDSIDLERDPGIYIPLPQGMLVLRNLRPNLDKHQHYPASARTSAQGLWSGEPMLLYQNSGEQYNDEFYKGKINENI